MAKFNNALLGRVQTKIENQPKTETNILDMIHTKESSKIVYHDIYELVPDEDNERKEITSESVKELKASILALGVMDNLVVQPGTNIVIAGHRRLVALKELVAEGHEEFRRQACKEIDYDKIDIPGVSAQQKRNYGRIISNLSQEPLEYNELNKAVKELEEFYKAARKAGDSRFEGVSTRALIADTLNVSESTVQRIKKIENKATEEVKAALENKTITQDEALNIIKQPKEKQNFFLPKKEESVPEEPVYEETDYIKPTAQHISESENKPSIKKENISCIKSEDLKKIRKVTKQLYSIIDKEISADKLLIIQNNLNAMTSKLDNIMDVLDNL